MILLQMEVPDQLDDHAASQFLVRTLSAGTVDEPAHVVWPVHGWEVQPATLLLSEQTTCGEV